MPALTTKRVTAFDLFADWRDGRVLLVESGSPVPLQVHRSLKISIERDGPETFRVLEGRESGLGTFSLALPKGLRTVLFRAAIGLDGTLELETRDASEDAAGSLDSRILALLEEEAGRGQPWVEEHVVAERLGIPTRREMVLDDAWFVAREALLRGDFIERRVYREELGRGYQESRELALTERGRGRGGRYLADTAVLEALVRLVEIAEAPAPSVEVTPSFTTSDTDREDALRILLVGLVLGVLLGFALAAALL